VKKIEAGRVIVKDQTPRTHEFEVAFGLNILAGNGATVTKGQRLTE